MRIGMSFWGICAPFDRQPTIDTADGHRYGRPILVDALEARGHVVVALQPPMGPSMLAYDEGFPNLDLLFVEWRWPIYKEAGVTRQMQLLRQYCGKTPVILFDTDLKMTLEDELMWPEATVASAAKHFVRRREYLPFWSDWRRLFSVVEPLPVYGYIGNNYERPLEFRKYYFNTAAALRACGIQTTMIGNWLQKSPEREPSEQLIADYPSVAFHPRMDFKTSMVMQNRFICTTHVTKPEYTATGFVSPRHIEAAMCGCPALTPDDAPFTVAAVQVFKAMSLDARRRVVETQIEMLKAVPEYDVKYAVQFLEDHA